jgi:hypothetical protein
VVRTLSIALALVGLLVLVALGSAGGGWGGDAEELEVPSAFVNVAYTLGILFLISMGVIAIWALTGPKSDVRIEKPIGNGLIGFALFTLVLLFWYAYVEKNPLRPQEQEADPQGVATGTTPGAPEGFAEAPGPQFQWWIAGCALLALVALLAYERRRGRRRPRTAAEELEDVLDEALAELEGELDGDPRRAVIQAYARMERVLAAHGHARHPAEAPLEYLARILGELDVRPTAAHALTELFERAKFSRHEIDAAMREEAVASLEAVRDDLRAAA